MKLVSALFLLVLCLSATSFAAPSTCVSTDQIVCNILESAGTLYLNTTLENVTQTYVGRDPASRDPALIKLKAQAKQLKTAHVCKVIINNIDDEIL